MTKFYKSQLNFPAVGHFFKCSFTNVAVQQQVSDHIQPEKSYLLIRIQVLEIISYFSYHSLYSVHRKKKSIALIQTGKWDVPKRIKYFGFSFVNKLICLFRFRFKLKLSKILFMHLFYKHFPIYVYKEEHTLSLFFLYIFFFFFPFSL